MAGAQDYMGLLYVIYQTWNIAPPSYCWGYSVSILEYSDEYGRGHNINRGTRLNRYVAITDCWWPSACKGDGNRLAMTIFWYESTWWRWNKVKVTQSYTLSSKGFIRTIIGVNFKRVVSAVLFLLWWQGFDTWWPHETRSRSLICNPFLGLH